jgi:hypothetical protein
MHTWSVFLSISIMDNTIHYMGMYTLYRSCLSIDVKCMYSDEVYSIYPAKISYEDIGLITGIYTM